MARKDDSKVTRRVNSRMQMTKLGMFSPPRHPKNILWYLTHRYLFRGLGILQLEVWDNLLKRYVHDPKNGIRQTPESRTSARGNITDQVFHAEEKMSISTYVTAAAVAEVEEIELVAIWKMAKGRRIVGKVRFPLTPDVVVNLKDDEETELITDVNNFLQSNDDADDTVDHLIQRLLEYKKRKAAGESND